MTVDQLLPPQSDYEYFVADWRMSDAAMKTLANLLISRRPRTILEIGPGLSSLMLFRYQDFLLDEVHITILDEQSEWHSKFRMVAQKYLNNEHLDIVATKLLSDGYYDATKLPTNPTSYDLIILDGPADSVARSSVPAMAVLNTRINSHTCVVVDDTHRQSELLLVDWLQQFREKRYGVSFVREVSLDEVYRPRSTTFLTPPVL